MTTSPPTVSAETKAKLDGILKRHVDSGLIPAATFAIATADPKAAPIYFKAEGDKVFGQPDKGQIDEDTAIEDGKAVQHKATKQITLRHLLTHTNGTGYDVMVPLLGEWVKLNNASTVISTDLTVKSFELPLIFEGGEGWNYSLGLDWTGILIERITGQSLEDYFQEHVFKPVGATTLTFYPKDAAYEHLQQVVTHDPADHKLIVFPGIRDCTPGSAKGQASGGAGLYGTARDYLRVLQGVMASAQPGGLISPESFKLLFTNQLPEAPEGTFKGQLDFARFVPHIDPSLIDSGHLTHSLGGFVCTVDSPHGRKKDSMWWEGIYKTFYWLDPTTGVTGVFTTQLFAFGVPNEPFDLAFNELERAFYDSLGK